ncbi:MAG: hypothetical protein MI919_25310, partial [Holophagales bacterium]|nr:hypothetical protein [Holophagales bacterium]
MPKPRDPRSSESSTASAPPSPAERRSLLRRSARLAVGLLLLLLAALLLAAAGVAWLVGSESGRGWLRGEVERRVLEASGLELALGDLRLEPGAGRIEVRGLVLGSPGVAPFLRAEQLVARLDVGALLDRRLEILDLEVRGPIVDLEAPL